MLQLFRDENLINGRIISYSKSSYKRMHPENEIYFNANIFVLGEGKIWYGDLDITKDQEKLERIAKYLCKDLFILTEMEGRFEKEDLKDSEIISRAVRKITK